MDKLSELFLKPKKASDDILCIVLWVMVSISSVFIMLGLYYDYYVLHSTAIELFVFTFLLAVAVTISSLHVRWKIKNRLRTSLTTEEKDLLFYIYDRSQNGVNAVYIPYDNAVAIHLKYRRILRRYDIPKVTREQYAFQRDGTYCFLYGIRQLPKDFLYKHKEEFQRNNFPSTKLRKELDRFQ